MRLGVQTCSEDKYYIRIHNVRNEPIELRWRLHTPSNPVFASEGENLQIPATTDKTLPHIFVKHQQGTRLVALVGAHGTRFLRLHLQGPGPCPSSS
jgi:hypothetical protein